MTYRTGEFLLVIGKIRHNEKVRYLRPSYINTLQLSQNYFELLFSLMIQDHAYRYYQPISHRLQLPEKEKMQSKRDGNKYKIVILLEHLCSNFID